MRPSRRALAIALAGMVVAMGLRSLLTPWLGPAVPFVLAYVGLIVVQASAGRRAAAVYVLGCLLWSQLMPWPRASAAHALVFAVACAGVGLFLDRVLVLRHPAADALASPAGHPLRWLRLGLALLLVLPVIFYGSVAWYSHGQTLAEAQRRLDGVARVAEEYAARLVQTNRLIAQQVALDLGDAEDEPLRGDQALWHARLQRMVADLPQVQSVWVWDAQGRPLLTSLFATPPATLQVTDRDYFIACRDTPAPWHTSAVHVSRTLNEAFFNISRCRRAADGRFLGVVTAALPPAHFRGFFQPLLQAEPGLRLRLLRSDGTVLVDSAEHAVPAEPALLRAVADRQPTRQVLDGGAQGAQDLVLRPLPDLPLVVVASLPRGAALQAWQRSAAVLAVALFPASFAAAYVALLAIQRTRRELTAVAQLRQESEQRGRAEQALRQAQKLEALGQLTGGVAHDFNNLLMVIHTNAFLIGRRDPTLADSRALQALQRAVASGTQLTRQLLAFAKRQPLRPETLRLQDSLPVLADLLKTSVGARVVLEVKVEPDTAPVHVDAAELELALLNLAINARDAMPEGGRLDVVAANRPDAQVAIEVRDSGCGIPPEQLDKVFEPFFSTKPPGQGTGLGLSQVWGFGEQAGGRVQLNSTPGRGTTVTLLLPAASPVPAAAEDGPVLPAKPLPRRVLMVEDNEEVAQATTLLLQSLGCEVRRAANADDGLTMLDATPEPPDLLLSDVVMPGRLNGLGLARAVRQRRPGLPVLLMTGYTTELAAATEEGFRVLPKPFDAQTLAQALGDALAAKDPVP